MKSLLALIIAFFIIGFYIGIIFLSVKFIWPLIPGWGQGLGYIILSILLIGSPIICYLPYAKRKKAEQLKIKDKQE